MSSAPTAPSSRPSDPTPLRLTLIGAGTIGLSFAALHLLCATPSTPVSLTVYDTRPDLVEYMRSSLPEYYFDSAPPPPPEKGVSAQKQEWFASLLASGWLRLLPSSTTSSESSESGSLETAVRDADIVQEQGPENLPFKRSIWRAIERHAPPTCLFWSSTSGITASLQSQDMRDRSRLLVVHPYNPPHVMPLLEIVPSPDTNPEVVSRTVEYWRRIGREPVVLRKEVTGFVANRLAFALLREAMHLVRERVVDVAELDRVVQTSMGPRWAVAGPFKSYHMGGGPGGLRGFMRNIGGTVQACWDDAGREDVGDEGDGGMEEVYRQTEEAYGKQLGKKDTSDRDRVTKEVLKATRGRAMSL